LAACGNAANQRAIALALSQLAKISDWLSPKAALKSV
jgi:hypothetical protein